MGKYIKSYEHFKEIEKHVYYEETFKYVTNRYIKEHLDQFKNTPEYQSDLEYKKYIDYIDNTDINDLI